MKCQPLDVRFSPARGTYSVLNLGPTDRGPGAERWVRPLATHRRTPRVGALVRRTYTHMSDEARVGRGREPKDTRKRKKARHNGRRSKFSSLSLLYCESDLSLEWVVEASAPRTQINPQHLKPHTCTSTTREVSARRPHPLHLWG